ncbi:MAG: helix-turn-helix domain-containing protein [Cyanobacteria bacterium RUI128]|nr:helix-turn-helix domain-containing protein [Cyanobacteria bacterium RUI128]
MDDKLKQFGKRVAWLRSKKNITQEKLAELIGYSTNHISKLELARTNPSFDLIIKIADALNIEPKELFDIEAKSSNDDLVDEIILSLKDLTHPQQEFIHKTIKNLIEL